MYVIKNGTIHTGTGEVLENYDILIEGKKIKKIEKNICEADAEIIDATGKQVFLREQSMHTTSIIKVDRSFWLLVEEDGTRKKENQLVN